MIHMLILTMHKFRASSRYPPRTNPSSALVEESLLYIEHKQGHSQKTLWGLWVVVDLKRHYINIRN